MMFLIADAADEAADGERHHHDVGKMRLVRCA